MPPHDSYLLDLLIEHQLLTADEALKLWVDLGDLQSSDSSESAVYSTLIAGGFVSEDNILSLLATIEGVGLLGSHVMDERHGGSSLRELLSPSQSRNYGMVPYQLEEDRVTLVASYPCEFDEVDIVEHLLNRSVLLLLAPKSTRDQLFERVYGCSFDASFASGESETQVNRSTPLQVNGSHAVETATPISDDADESEIRRYVDWVIKDAIGRGASDIHFEPLEKRFRVRCRVDGVLQQLDQPMVKLQDAILSRVKLISDLDIAEKRMPQDGRFHLNLDDRQYDFRVSTVPSTHGEGIVIRILDKERLSIGLPELGMLDEHQSTFERIIRAPDGMFLVTGPTGSGKSTSLYAALNHINDPSVKIITVEDPVEYHIEGINQVQVRNEVNMTFSAALRSILRQAPNIIMVGEIRDRETADIAIHASLTGHMVFSTLHTNDAPSAVTRLMDMGVKPFLVSAALRAVMAQRLVRRIPEANRIPYPVAEWQLQALGPSYDFLKGKQFYHAGESQRDYRGRLGLFELFEVNDLLKAVIHQNSTLSNLRSHLRNHGFRNMRYDGVCKALEGSTSIEEVLSVTPSEEVLFV